MRKKKQVQGVEHKCPDFSLDDSSMKSDAAIKDPLHESPALSSCERIREFKTKKIKKRKKAKIQHDVDQSNVNGCGTSESTFSSKNPAPAFDMPIEHTIQYASTDAVMKQSCVETEICLRQSEEKEKNMLIKAAETSDDLGQGVEHKGPDFSLDDYIVKTDAAIKDPLHECPALPYLSDSERIAEFKTKQNRKRKKTKTEHNAAKSNVNGSGTPENSFSSKNLAPALDIPSEQALQCVSTDAAMRQSRFERNICLGQNEEKEQNVLIKAAETSDGLGQGVELKGLDFSLKDSSVKTDAAIKNPLPESPALLDLSNSERIVEFKSKKIRKRKKMKTKRNVAKNNVNGRGTPENIFSSKDLTPALDMPSEHAIQCVSADAVMRQSRVETDICLVENKEKEQSMLIKAAETSVDLGQGVELKGPDFSLDDSSMKTDAAIKNPLHESPALPDLSNSERTGEFKARKNRKKKKAKTERNVAKSNVNGGHTPENSFSSKNLTPTLDIYLGENEEKEQKMLIKAAETSDDLGQGVEHKGLDFSLDDSSVKTDAAMKDPLHESPALPDLSNSERIAEFKTKKNRKMKKAKAENNVTKSNVNGSGTPENSFSSKNLTPALDVPSEHTIQCATTDALMRQSCVEMDICLAENEEKEQPMITKAAEKSSGECDIQDEDCNCNSVVGANAQLFAKDSVSEVVKLNNEQSINDICSNPEERNGSVKDRSPVKKHDEHLAVDDFSDELQCVKTDTRTKVFNSNYSRNEDCPIAVNCNEEPTMQDHLMDDSHKFSDGPSTDDLIERETEHSRDRVTLQSGVADEEMELMTVDNSEPRFINRSSVVDIPVTQLEETSARQLDHTEITRNDLCCPGDVSDLSRATANNGNSNISQFSLDRTIVHNPKNKLLILDVNGLLADCVGGFPGASQLPEPDFWLRRKRVYKRPFCDDFLQFCFDRFHVGVWSSRAKFNVDDIIKFLMGESASKLLFCWSQSQCTHTRFTTVENKNKPLVLKELKKLWEKRDPTLPWKRGEFNESNTLLLDDSPYKALLNPKHTGVFPYSYEYHHNRDSSLGPGGDLRVYLEGLATAENVQEYVSSNPFGQRPIREANVSWGYYCKVIEEVKARKKKR